MNIESFEVLHKFKSRKNDVYLVKTEGADGSCAEYVHKIFRSAEAASKEARLLKELKNGGLNVPHVYYAGGTSIVMEYIRGIVLCDKISEIEKASGTQEAQSEEEARIITRELSSWLRSFYAYGKAAGCSLILGDVNLRNFIFDGRVWGIDFEEVKTGIIEEDIGKICAFLLTYNPAFTPWKRRFAVSLLEGLSGEITFDMGIVREEFKKELDSIEKRRRLPIPRDFAEGNFF